MNEAVFVWLVSSVKEIISSHVCRTRLKKWKKSSWKKPVTIFHFHVTSGMISFPYLFWFHWIIYHNWLSISLIRRNVLVNFVPFVFRQSFANLFSNKSHLFSSNWGHIYIFHMFFFFLKTYNCRISWNCRQYWFEWKLLEIGRFCHIVWPVICYLFIICTFATAN